MHFLHAKILIIFYIMEIIIMHYYSVLLFILLKNVNNIIEYRSILYMLNGNIKKKNRITIE